MGSRYMTLARGIEYAMPFGLPRLVGFCQGAAAECGYSMVHEIIDEFENLPESFAQVRPAAPLGDLPLHVLSRDPAQLETAGVSPEVARALHGYTALFDPGLASAFSLDPLGPSAAITYYLEGHIIFGQGATSCGN